MDAEVNKQAGSIHIVVISIGLIILVGVLCVLGFNAWNKQQQPAQSQSPKQNTESKQSSNTKLGEIAHVDMTKTIYPVPATSQSLDLKVENVSRGVKYYFDNNGKIEEFQPKAGMEWVQVKVKIIASSNNTKNFQAASDQFVYVTDGGEYEYASLLVYSMGSDGMPQLHNTISDEGNCSDSNGGYKNLAAGQDCRYNLYYIVPINDHGSLEYHYRNDKVGAKLLLE